MENNKLYESACEWFDLELKDYVWYFDTPKQRFKYTPGSIWLINPNTKKWAFELKKSGHLWYFHYIRNNFLELYPINDIEFEEIVKLRVEDVLKRGVTTTPSGGNTPNNLVEDVLKRGVTTTQRARAWWPQGVEDVLKRGVTTDFKGGEFETFKVEDALKRGVTTTALSEAIRCARVEDALKRGVTTTESFEWGQACLVEDVLKRGVTTTLNTSQIENGFGE